MPTKKTEVKEKKPRGRPKFADRSKVASVLINFRITEESRERYHRAAKAEGLSLTDWVMALADAAAPPKSVTAR